MPDFIHLAGGARLEPDDAAFPRVAFGYAADPADLPESHYLTVGGRQYQADAGSCVAHGYSAVVESFAAERGAGLQLCRQDIYFGARWVEHNGAETRDGGAFPSKAREWLANYGTVTEARKPYKASDVTTWRPPAEWAPDRKLLSVGFAAVSRTAEHLMTEVADGKAVAVCHSVYPSLFHLGVGGIEGGVSGPSQGGHCRAIVGYDRTKATNGFGPGAFLVLNSWQGWGIQHPTQAGIDSLSWVPFSVMADPKWLNDAAVIDRPPEMYP